VSISLSLLIEEHVDRKDIERIVYSLGFKKVEEYENTYLWYDDNYGSTRGCWFSFSYDYEINLNYDTEEKRIYKTCCGTTTYAGRSHDDLEMQMEVLREIQKEFGGVVYDQDEDQYGFFDNFLPKLTRTEIACGLAYLHYHQNLQKVRFLIEEVDMERVKAEAELGLEDWNKPLIRNNTLVPFCVSVLETFLKLFFKRYLETNEEAVNLIFKKKESLPYSVIKELLSGKRTIIDIELEKYSFQNFKSANNAYTKYLDFNLFNVLRQTVTYDGKETSIISVLNELIELRHVIIHEAIFNNELSKERMEKYYYFLEKFGEEFINRFMEKHKLRLLLEKEL
jgi:hypothetical protein